MKPVTHSKVEQLQYGAISYSRYTERSHEHDRGTVILHGGNHDRVIKDYPHIARVYRLHEGINRFFGSDYFFAEEKLDGYNVRIIKHNNEIVAVTRGGFICPFSTEWVQYWRGSFRLDDFFVMHPDRIICAEFVGDNPYNSKRDISIPSGLSFFCFDIMRNDGKLIPVNDKYEIFGMLNLPQVRSFGRFRINDFAGLKEIILELNRTRREGIVLKGTGGNRSIKFVTAESDLLDIEKSLAYFYDIEPGFYSNRLMRVSLFVQEFKLDEAEYMEKLGRAILKGYSFFSDYEGSIETFTIYMHSMENWKALKKLIILHKDIVHDSIDPVEIDGGMLHKIVFGRKHKKSTERYHLILGGHEE
jgi:putative ATP-dependent DNA ligase